MVSSIKKHNYYIISVFSVYLDTAWLFSLTKSLNHDVLSFWAHKSPHELLPCSEHMKKLPYAGCSLVIDCSIGLHAKQLILEKKSCSYHVCTKVKLWFNWKKGVLPRRIKRYATLKSNIFFNFLFAAFTMPHHFQ